MRRTPLLRKTPMPRSKTPLARSEMHRGAPLKTRLRRPRMRKTVRDSVFDRACGQCDMCGHLLNPEVWECHHRKLRAAGGRDTVENLLALHPVCHGRAHANPAWAKDCGYIVRSTDEPDSVPVLLHGHTLHVAAAQWARA